MAALSDAQLWTICEGQWGNSQAAIVAFCIALAESGGDPTATHKNTNGTTDYGLFQINSVHTALLNGANWQDPQTNANMAYQLYTASHNSFTPWVTYTIGSYARFAARAQAAQKAGGAPVPSGGGSGSTTSTDGAGKTPVDPSNPVSVATSGSTWLRLGEFACGGILLFILGASLMKNTGVVKAAKSVAKVAAVA